MTHSLAGALLTAALLGLFGSTHCIAMCGGVVGALSGGLVTLRSGGQRRLPPVGRIAGYHLGRLASYATGGVVAGSLGQLVHHVPFVAGAEMGLRAVAAGFLLVLGLSLTRFGALGPLERLVAPVWNVLRPLASRWLASPSPAASLALGALWGWMPCGLVYAALGVALVTGTSAGGALVMLAFGLGTLPMLLLLGALAGRWASHLRQPRVRSAAGLVVTAFAFVQLVSTGVAMAQPAETSCCPSWPSRALASVLR